MADSPYRMSISLNVLNHLGLNLYSNTPAVLAEVIANSWDADATEVRVDFERKGKKITISDDGHGMNLDDVNSRYLFVGYQKRNEFLETPSGRKPMGRKGIGKLSLFSIANRICVYSRRKDSDAVAFKLDAGKIRRMIDGENPSTVEQYAPEEIDPGNKIKNYGTIIEITQLKKLNLTQASIDGLRKRVARRFWLEGAKTKFRIYINGKEITHSDRDYFHKARFLFQYGDHDYRQYCRNPDKDEAGKALCFPRPNTLENPDEESSGDWEIRGWVAMSRHSYDLDSDDEDENLNRITILVRGKVAQEDILQEFRLGGMFTKYIYGEIHADFLDDDDSDDIATSGRQKISEDDPRYQALKSFLKEELQHIWSKTNKLKDRAGLETAKQSNPHVKEWFDNLKLKPAREAAGKIFGALDKAGIDEVHKEELYASGILAIEALSMRHALDSLERIDESNVEVLVEHLSDIDAIESARYSEIVRGRLKVIDTLKQKVENDSLEKVLQKYIFNHLWLLDPAWDRATEFANMEEVVQRVVGGIKEKSRLDIRYKRMMAGHVIIELKRASVRLEKHDLEGQAKKYLGAVRRELEQFGETPEPLQAICIVGKLPRAWDNPIDRKNDEISLMPHSIRIITYKELINNALSAYSKFAKEAAKMDDLIELINKVRSHSGKA